MAEERVSFQLKADFKELDRLCRIVESFGKDHDLPEKVVFALNLALDELVTNSIKYGQTHGGEHVIRVGLSYAPGLIVADVEDNGRPFNPLDAPRPNIDSPIEQREIGGLGLYLLRCLMDEAHYTRSGDKNLIQLKKKLTTPNH